MTSSARLFLAGVALVGVAVLAAAYFVARTPGDVITTGLIEPGTAGGGRGEVDYTLRSGESATDVGKDLQELGVIRSARQFQVLVSLMGLQDKLSAGDYRLTKGSAVLSVIDTVTVKQQVPTLRVTFPEGIRLEEMAVIAEQAGFGTSQQFMDAVAAATLSPDLEAALPPAETLAGPRLQGYLFPDTYILPEGATAADLVSLMLETFDERFSPALREAVRARGLTTHQAVTLAAIVEREAVLEEERPLIAGVFYNRLAEGDLLGADPTTQFVAAMDPASVELHGWWKKELTIDDLETPSPYNTRLVPGLPPGPITNPGLASLEAAANPATTDLYYFVADARKGDGSHLFAATIAEHERNRALVAE
jgi:UPF0755 protein